MSAETTPAEEPIDLLTPQQEHFVRLVASGLKPSSAAQKAGYSASYARKAGQLLHVPTIARELKAVQTAVRDSIAYDASAAMKECAEAIAFAKQHKNANAYVKAVELRAKLSGLLVERIEVFSMDMKGALEMAKRRVRHLTPNGEAENLDLIEDASGKNLVN